MKSSNASKSMASPTVPICKILDETKASHATHIRKLKELSSLYAKFQTSIPTFVNAFRQALTPIFNFHPRTASADRVVKFVSLFLITKVNALTNGEGDAFVEDFLRFLLLAASAANKTARFRACQIISEIIMRLPDDTEVSSELWGEVIECMKLRVGDKVPVVRIFAVRSLSRFAYDAENSDILELFLQTLQLEQSSDVRKTILLSLPPSIETATSVIDCTLDVSESVRKAAYQVLANKFPLQSLSIKMRTLILQRGLSDRSVAVGKECLKLLTDEWLKKCCNGELIELLKFLDVETYELVGESVMSALLKAGLVKLQDNQSIRQFIVSPGEANEGNCDNTICLMEAEAALYWRMVCKHLHVEAQAKGSDAAMTMGTESAVYASEASDSNDLLDKILPAAVSEYVDLVKAHISAGPNYIFASRQLLLLAAVLDFSDATNRKGGSGLVQELLRRPPYHELDDSGHTIIIGDGISLGGDKSWAIAVWELAKQVHGSLGELEEVILSILEELARPCRERTADFLQWLHCLSVVGLLLENANSFRWMQEKAIQPSEILHSLLLPAAKHAHLEVQRGAVRCLGLYGLLEHKPSVELVKQLRLSFSWGSHSIAAMASKGLFDLGMWHGPQEVDKSLNTNFSSELQDYNLASTSPELDGADGDLYIEFLNLLFAGFEKYDMHNSAEIDDSESPLAILGEGFAKFLLLSEKYPTMDAVSHPFLLAKLINLYFCSDSKVLPRLKQCLSVFFEHYAIISLNHKKCLCKAFVPNMRSMWPGIDGNAAGSTLMVSTQRKRAIQASRFMLQMMQAPLHRKDSSSSSLKASEHLDSSADPAPDIEYGEEGLAILIAVEVARFPAKKSSAEKSYITALCKVLVLVKFRSSEQVGIKLMVQLLNHVIKAVASEKDLQKELKQMSESLKALDMHPEIKLSSEQAQMLFGKLGIEMDLDVYESTDILPTPAPQTRRRRVRQHIREEVETSSEDEASVVAAVPTNGGLASARSHRASKAAAMSKMSKLTAQKPKITEDDSEDNDDCSEESDGEVTSEDDSVDAFE
ncbi:hypothetical protein LIER_33718 [Lithospermum erythrorhizon]|uniref:Nuclear condensin complex subunit 3 C-terminal domain-containing protein n=1 Tax=Lithospermum erythrorhizon TaxID=34254 RepID=A0AAV3S004_LITER